MRPAIRHAVLAVCVLAIALGLGAASAAGGSSRTTAVGVSEREFRITPYRGTVPPGRVKFNVKNFGEDVHDLVVLSPHGNPIGTTGEIRAGDRATLVVRMKKLGTYRLICTKADHARLGMRARLRVRKPRG